MKIKEMNKKEHMKILSNSLMFLFLAALSVLPANAGLQATGPINATNGYPIWYQDTNGLGLEIQTVADNFDGIAAPVDPANPLSVQVGFGAETFYWSADSTIAFPDFGVPTPRPSFALLVLATEGAYAPFETPTAGFEQVFNRIRVRLVNPPAAGTYTITHPYGTDTVVVDAAGATTTVTDDIGCFVTPGVIDSCATINPATGKPFFALVEGPGTPAIPNRIGPWLTRADGQTFVNPANGRRYISILGDAVPVTGSPTGNNFFRVQGPAGVDLDPGPAISNVVTNNLFGLTGKIFVFGGISGFKINSASGAGIPGWSITLKNQTTQAVINTTTTDATGFYQFLNLAPGTYNVTEEIRPTFAPQSPTFRVVPVASLMVPNQNFTNLQIIPGVTMTADVPAKTTNLGVAATYILTINNTGNAPDTYTLNASASTPAGATVILSPPTITLANGANATVQLSVNSTALGTFSVTVTAASAANPLVTASVTTITTVVGIIVTPNIAMLKNGTTQQFTATPANVLPVNWTSSNPLVGSIDANGLFTAVGPGTATITASNTTLGLSGSAIVTVGQNTLAQTLGAGYNLIIVPMDNTGLTANSLLQLVTAQNPGVSGQKVVKWNPATQAFEAFTAAGLGDFPIVAGQAYFVKVSAPGTVTIAGNIMGTIV